MTEHPIVFAGPMVRAILDGRKTQTRRVIKPQPAALFAGFGRLPTCECHPFGFHDGGRHWRCPYGQPGDRLWVRETFCTDREFGGYPHNKVYYRAGRFGAGDLDESDFAWCKDGTCSHKPNDAECSPDFRWRPSIHMPRWASRITLEVTDVRVERVRDISEEDARAEGCQGDFNRVPSPHDPGFIRVTARERFERLWDSINDARGFGWTANPWVWVVNFKVAEVVR